MPTPSEPKPANVPSRWPEIAITLVTGIMAGYLVWPQIFSGTEADNTVTLAKLDQRAAMLRKLTDPVQRDSVCIGLSAFGRQLDQQIPKDARVFFSGNVGKENASRLGYYFFLRNYLFPRELQISTDRKAAYTFDGFTGVDATSAEQLRTNGFDLWLKFGADGNIGFQPLTEKGMPKQ
jgi:hypothetical protein